MAKPEKVLASELLEREVVDLQAGVVLGAIVDFALAREGRVLLLGVLPPEWYRGGLGLAPAAVASVARERVCVSDNSALTSFGPDSSAADWLTYDQLQGRGVVEQDGSLLGMLVDFAFLLADGRICDLVVLDSAEDRRLRIPLKAITSIGSDYIVIERGPVAVAVAEKGALPPAVAPVSSSVAQQILADNPVAAGAVAAAVTTADIIEHAAARIAEPAEAVNAPDGAALFEAAAEPGQLSQFDQKRANFLRGKLAHRDLLSHDGELLVARGAVLDESAIRLLVKHEVLSDVFVEMTVSR